MSHRFDLGDATWQGYELKNKPPKGETLKELAALGFDINWILTGLGTPPSHRRGISDGGQAAFEKPTVFRNEGNLGPGYVMVPRYDIQAAAGPGAWVDREQAVDFLAFKESWVRRALRVDPRNLGLIEALGDSMEPTIRSGDLLLIDAGVDQVIDDAIYVLVIDGMAVVKRVQRLVNGALTVKSDNPAYADQALTAAETANIRVAGRVRWIGRLI